MAVKFALVSLCVDTQASLAAAAAGKLQTQAPSSLRTGDGYGPLETSTRAAPRAGIGINSIGPLPYAKGLSGAARAGRQQSRARGWSWVLVIACRTLAKRRGPGCAGGTARACPAMLESFLSTPLRAACPWTGSGPSRSLWMAAPVPGACTATYRYQASSEATSVF